MIAEIYCKDTKEMIDTKECIRCLHNKIMVKNNMWKFECRYKFNSGFSMVELEKE